MSDSQGTYGMHWTAIFQVKPGVLLTAWWSLSGSQLEYIQIDPASNIIFSVLQVFTIELHLLRITCSDCAMLAQSHIVTGRKIVHKMQ